MSCVGDLQQDISATAGMLQSLMAVLATCQRPSRSKIMHLLEEQNKQAKPIDMRELFPESLRPKTRTMVFWANLSARIC